MTSPYITFEEMEEGVEYVSRHKATGALSAFVFRKFDGTPCVRSIDDLWIPTRPDGGLLLYPIPAYTPPNSWDDMKRGDYLYVSGGFSQSDRNYWFRDDVLLRCSDEEWEAAGDYRKHLRKKAGES